MKRALLWLLVMALLGTLFWMGYIAWKDDARCYHHATDPMEGCRE